MPDIFLSCNREEQAKAKLVANALTGEGFDVWWDTVLRAGQTHDEVTEGQLHAARAVVVLWSSRSVRSKWVRAEVTLGDRKSALIQVMIQPCDRPIMFELIQTADLVGWEGDTTARPGVHSSRMCAIRWTARRRVPGQRQPARPRPRRQGSKTRQRRIRSRRLSGCRSKMVTTPGSWSRIWNAIRMDILQASPESASQRSARRSGSQRPHPGSRRCRFRRRRCPGPRGLDRRHNGQTLSSKPGRRKAHPAGAGRETPSRLLQVSPASLCWPWRPSLCFQG